MPRRLFIGLFLLPLPLFAAPPKDELAYAVGARLGMRLQQEMPGLELSELLLGLRQAYRGEALEIPPERIEQLWSSRSTCWASAEMQKRRSPAWRRAVS